MGVWYETGSLPTHYEQHRRRLAAVHGSAKYRQVLCHVSVTHQGGGRMFTTLGRSLLVMPVRCR